MLEQIGAADKPLLRVFNKADIMPGGLQAVDKASGAAWISALSGAGVEELLGKGCRAFIGRAAAPHGPVKCRPGKTESIALPPWPRPARTRVAWWRLDTGFGNDPPGL